MEKQHQRMKKLSIDAVSYCSKKISDLTVYPHAINIAIPVEKDFIFAASFWV